MSKKEEVAKKMYHMAGGKKQHSTMGEHVGKKVGEKVHMTNPDGKVEGEMYRMTGDRPHEQGGERATQAHSTKLEKNKGEKSKQSDTKGKFSMR